MDVVVAMLCYLLVILPYSILLFVSYSLNNKEFHERIHKEEANASNYVMFMSSYLYMDIGATLPKPNL